MKRKEKIYGLNDTIANAQQMHLCLIIRRWHLSCQISLGFSTVRTLRAEPWANAAPKERRQIWVNLFSALLFLSKQITEFRTMNFLKASIALAFSGRKTIPYLQKWSSNVLQYSHYSGH